LAEVRALSVRVLQEMTEINTETVRKIFSRGFAKETNVCSFCSSFLTPDRKHQRAASFVEFVERIDVDRNVLKEL
jgi:hypothetical protein